MLTGVSSTTKTNLLLGAGLICTGYTSGSGGTVTGIVGATRGGGSFAAVPTIRTIPADGLPENIKDYEYIDYWTATLNVTLIETTAAAIQLALAGASASTSANVTTITPAQGLVASASFAALYWVGDTSDGKKAVIKLSNAINKNGFNLNFAPRGEGTFALEAVAHYDVSALSTVPFEIILDKSSAA